MTSWREPDYQAQLQLTREQYLILAGNTFEIRINRQGYSRSVGGMLLVNNANSPKYSPMEIHAMVWIDSKNAIIPVGSDLQVEVYETIEFDFTDEENKLANCQLPITINSVLHSYYEALDESIKTNINTKEAY